MRLPCWCVCVALLAHVAGPSFAEAAHGSGRGQAPGGDMSGIESEGGGSGGAEAAAGLKETDSGDPRDETGDGGNVAGGSGEGSGGGDNVDGGDGGGENGDREKDAIASSLVNGVNGLLGSMLRVAEKDNSGGISHDDGRETVSTRDHHRRDLRPVFADPSEDDSGSGKGDETALHPVVDPSSIIADLQNDREEREEKEEMNEFLPYYGGAFEEPESDMSSSNVNSMMRAVTSAEPSATAGAAAAAAAVVAGADSDGDGDGASSASMPEEVSSQDEQPACRNYLRWHHCVKMLAHTGCEQWVKMESSKKVARLLAHGLIAHHGAFLVHDLCPRLCDGCAQQAVEESYSNLRDDGRGNSPGKSSPADDRNTNKNTEDFGGVFDVIGNLFGSSKTSPSPENGASTGTGPDDVNAVITSPNTADSRASDTSTRIDDVEHAAAGQHNRDEQGTRPQTGGHKKDGWWSGLEAAVSDADHVVIEHRHLFEVASLVLLLLMGTALCVGCCCCYAGKRGSSGDYGGSKGGSGFGAGSFDDVGAAFSKSYEQYHDVEDPPVEGTASINGDGADSNLMDRERTTMGAKKRKSKRSQLSKKYEKVVDENRISSSKRKKKSKHKDKDAGGRRLSSRSSRHVLRGDVVEEEEEEEEENEKDMGIGGTAKSRRKSKKKKTEFVPRTSLSHDLFGNEGDADVTFDSGTLFGGQDDIWS